MTTLLLVLLGLALLPLALDLLGRFIIAPTIIAVLYVLFEVPFYQLCLVLATAGALLWLVAS